MTDEHNKLFSNSPNESVWKAIYENRLEDAQVEIKQKRPKKLSFFERFLGKSSPNSNTILLITDQFLELQMSADLSNLNLSIHQNGHEQFAELIRLLIAFDNNKTLNSFSLPIAEKAGSILQYLASEVEKQAGKYPENSIAAIVWVAGTSLREWSDILSSFFAQQKMLEQKTNVLLNKCKITCSIMSHYPGEVGPDMIAVGNALEDIGQKDESIKYYSAVIQDFERIIDGYHEYPDEKITEADIISINCLKEAYLNSERLHGISDYRDKIISLEVLLSLRNSG